MTAAGSTPAARSCARPAAAAPAKRAADEAAALRRLPLLLALLTLPCPAWGELGFTLSAASDDRFRGVSTSDKHPVATAEVSYDDAGGFYAGGSVTAGPTRYGGVRLLRSVQYAGYAHRLRPDAAFDVGVTNRLYGDYATIEYARRFAQAYVGVVGRKVSSHLFFAPDYDGYGGDALYAQVDASLYARGPWSVNAHGGALLPPGRNGYGRSVEVDWRLGVTRRLGPIGVSLNWVGSGPHDDGHRWTGTFILSASRSF